MPRKKRMWRKVFFRVKNALKQSKTKSSFLLKIAKFIKTRKR
jgi:hypothetical protein